ncbi:homeobox protein GHOX-7-like [Cydia pomonella]|uniref:homeobox protein GHOX-7-like n=1 Tax=Cydia pomonella TaxID=82600 RepID=UPI002ADD749E|nr:homeobox protein GHOX-7-like [Cydia pomonella]
MDVSPVRSSRGTDFSIERILSADSSRETPETPSWLCCTRYRPPRLPRAVNNVCRQRRSGRHARVPFTAAQAAALEAAYARAPYLAPPALRALAAALQLRDDRIKIWFQNRRARERREKCTNIAPPRAVALPPSRLPVTHTWTNEMRHVPTQDYTKQIGSLDVETTFEQSEESRDSADEDSPLDVETVD